MTMTDDDLKKTVVGYVESGECCNHDYVFTIEHWLDDLALTIPQRVLFCQTLVEVTTAAVMKAVKEGVPPELVETYLADMGGVKHAVRHARSEWEARQKGLIDLHAAAKERLALLTVDNGLSYVLERAREYADRAATPTDVIGRLTLIEDALIEPGTLAFDAVDFLRRPDLYS